jgi:hypothetical protein
LLGGDRLVARVAVEPLGVAVRERGRDRLVGRRPTMVTSLPKVPKKCPSSAAM